MVQHDRNAVQGTLASRRLFDKLTIQHARGGRNARAPPSQKSPSARIHEIIGGRGMTKKSLYLSAAAIATIAVFAAMPAPIHAQQAPAVSIGDTDLGGV